MQRDGADLGAVGAGGGSFAAEVGLGIAAGALAVGGVGVDRQARRKNDAGVTNLRGGDGVAEELGVLKRDVEARRRVGFTARRLRIQQRLEELLFTAGDRRVAALRFGEVFGVLVGLDPEGRRLRGPVAIVGIVGERVHRRADRRGLGEAAGIGQPGTAGGATGAALREALGFMNVVCRKAPEGQIGPCQGGHLGDLRDLEVEAVVAAGSHRDRDLDRDVQGWDDEGEQGRLGFGRFEVIDRRRAQQVVRVALIAGADGDQTNLSGGRAFLLGEDDRAALRDGIGVAEDAGGSFDDHVFGSLRHARTVEGEGGLQVGMPARLGRRGFCRKGFDPLGRVCGADAGERGEDQGEAERKGCPVKQLGA